VAPGGIPLPSGSEEDEDRSDGDLINCLEAKIVLDGSVRWV
jgi:hypothetical protein